MAETLKQFQQGDVLLQEVDRLPTEATQHAKRSHIVLARGERTGHSHVIESDQAELWTITRSDIIEVYLKALIPLTLVHEEHKPLPVPPGIYRVGRVKEYDYFSKMVRQIID